MIAKLSVTSKIDTELWKYFLTKWYFFGNLYTDSKLFFRLVNFVLHLMMFLVARECN